MPRRHSQLSPYDVDAGDLLGDGVLHLDARIDLDEVEAAGVGVDEEFHRAGILVACGAPDRQSRFADGAAHAGIEIRGGSHLHHLLMPPLHGAVALEEVHQPPMLVAEELHFDVPGPLDEFFDKHTRTAEGCLAFALRALQRHGEFVLATHNAHSPAAAAMGGFKHHRPAEILGDRKGIGETGHRLRAAGQDRHARFLGEAAGSGFVAEGAQQFDARPDKLDPGSAAGGSEIGVFREEAVAGVDGIDAVRLRQGHDRFDVEVGADRFAGAAHQIRFVCLEAMEGEAILVGVDRDGADAEFVGRAEHADGDLAAVGHKQLGDGTHGGGFLPVQLNWAEQACPTPWHRCRPCGVCTPGLEPQRAVAPIAPPDL